MITTHQTNDPYALEIRREGQPIGKLQWHVQPEPRLTYCDPSAFLTLSEIEHVLNAYKAARNREREAITIQRASEVYVRGRKFRVIREGASIDGMQPVTGGFQGFRRSLPVGAILTCEGRSMTRGDGVPIYKWLDHNGEFICADAEFRPSEGGMWNSRPSDGYLEPVAP